MSISANLALLTSFLQNLTISNIKTEAEHYVNRTLEQRNQDRETGFKNIDTPTTVFLAILGSNRTGFEGVIVKDDKQASEEFRPLYQQDRLIMQLHKDKFVPGIDNEISLHQSELNLMQQAIDETKKQDPKTNLEKLEAYKKATLTHLDNLKGMKSKLSTVFTRYTTTRDQAIGTSTIASTLTFGYYVNKSRFEEIIEKEDKKTAEQSAETEAAVQEQQENVAVPQKTTEKLVAAAPQKTASDLEKENEELQKKIAGLEKIKKEVSDTLAAVSRKSRRASVFDFGTKEEEPREHNYIKHINPTYCAVASKNR